MRFLNVYSLRHMIFIYWFFIYDLYISSSDGIGKISIVLLQEGVCKLCDCILIKTCVIVTYMYQYINWYCWKSFPGHSILYFTFSRNIYQFGEGFLYFGYNSIEYMRMVRLVDCAFLMILCWFLQSCRSFGRVWGSGHWRNFHRLG